MTLVTRALGHAWVRKASIKGILIIGVQQDKLQICVQDQVPGRTFIRHVRCKLSNYFSLLHVRKVHLGVFSGLIRAHVTHWLLCQTDEIQVIFKPCIGYVYGRTGES